MAASEHAQDGAEVASPAKPRRITLRRDITYQWGSVYKGWAMAWVRANRWKLAHELGDLDDLEQECALVFTRVAARYGHIVNNPAHFMSLYQTSLKRHFVKPAYKDSQKRAVLEVLNSLPVGQVYNEGPLLASLGQASEELQQVLVCLLNAPHEYLLLLFGPGADLSDAEVDARLRRLLKLPKRRRSFMAELRLLLNP